MKNRNLINKVEVAVVLFGEYETLDVFGPVEIFGRLIDLYHVRFYSLSGDLVSNSHGVSVLSEKLGNISVSPEIVLIPGGWGTRECVNDAMLVAKIRELAVSAKYVLTVCTGSALLAKTGLLDGRVATSNKRSFAWVASNGEEVCWDKGARWTVDGKYYTSSGVSAGMDMALGFLRDRHGNEFARKVAHEIEYNWMDDKDNDIFQAE